MVQPSGVKISKGFGDSKPEHESNLTLSRSRKHFRDRWRCYGQQPCRRPSVLHRTGLRFCVELESEKCSVSKRQHDPFLLIIDRFRTQECQHRVSVLPQQVVTRVKHPLPKLFLPHNTPLLLVQQIPHASQTVSSVFKDLWIVHNGFCRECIQRENVLTLVRV